MRQKKKIIVLFIIRSNTSYVTWRYKVLLCLTNLEKHTGRAEIGHLVMWSHIIFQYFREVFSELLNNYEIMSCYFYVICMVGCTPNRKKDVLWKVG